MEYTAGEPASKSNSNPDDESDYEDSETEPETSKFSRRSSTSDQFVSAQTPNRRVKQAGRNSEANKNKQNSGSSFSSSSSSSTNNDSDGNDNDSKKNEEFEEEPEYDGFGPGTGAQDNSSPYFREVNRESPQQQQQQQQPVYANNGVHIGGGQGQRQFPSQGQRQFPGQGFPPPRAQQPLYQQGGFQFQGLPPTQQGAQRAPQGLSSLGGGRFGGPQFAGPAGFPGFRPGGQRQFDPSNNGVGGADPSFQQGGYTPNFEIDGYSEDADQVSFI